MFGETQVRASAEVHREGVSLFAFQRHMDGKVSSVENAVVGPPTAPGFVMQPLVVLNHGAAQELLNDLWKAGFRPHDGQGGMAHIDAMKEHLADLRRLVFDPPAIEKVVETHVRTIGDPPAGSF
jgi:hypothetical protein